MIPLSVLDAAKGLIEMFGNTLYLKGNYQGKVVYQYVFPLNMSTGYPFLYIYDKQSNTTTEVTGFESLEIIEQLEL